MTGQYKRKHNDDKTWFRILRWNDGKMEIKHYAEEGYLKAELELEPNNPKHKTLLRMWNRVFESLPTGD